MFLGQTTNRKNALKLVLLVQFILFIIGAILENFEKLNSFTAMSISFIFLLTALYLFLKIRTVYSKFIFIATIFCFLGDLTLAKFLPGGLMVGLGMFAIAHVFFISGYVKTIFEEKGKVFSKAFFISEIILFTYFIILWIIFLENTSKGISFAIASLVYGLLITTMASAGWSLWQTDKKYLQTAIGAVLFVISDSLIAISITKTIPHIEIAIWTTYVLALYGIIYSKLR